jgi:threonyl-tRNA synthetase
MVTWLPKGVVILEKIKKLIRNVMKSNGYNEVITPQLADLNLWKQSGHWEMYRDHMFLAKGGDDGSTYALKPMSCPLHIDIFKTLCLSYKDLPYKIAEFGGCTRYEPSGSLHGLFRVRAFTQDDAHVFCTEDQMLSTIIEFISILKKIYHAFGFECIKVCLATRPKEFAGTIENWGKAEKVLETAAREGNLELSMNPGDGAFYGPKLEFYLEDSRKRIWQCGTVQVDFVLPNRLTATYITSENKKEFPVIIHHAVLGTIERFLGILLEHTKGQLPFWLCPLQIIIIPIHEDHLSYSEQLRKLLDSRGFISEIDKSQETLSYKIRKLWKQDKIPVIAVLGDQEVHNGTVSIRIRGKDVYNGLTIEEFIVKMEDMGRILE